MKAKKQNFIFTKFVPNYYINLYYVVNDSYSYYFGGVVRQR